MGNSLKVKDNLVSLIKFREHKENGQENYLITKELRYNESCHCGSGKKYKECCLKEDQRQGNVEEKVKCRWKKYWG